PERLQNRLLVRLDLHVDEIEDDDAAQIPKSQLPRDLLGRLDVGLEDRVFLVLLAGESARVDVDRHQRFRLIDGDVAAPLQPDLPLHRLLQLRFDPEVIEELLQVLDVALELLLAALRADGPDDEPRPLGPDLLDQGLEARALLTLLDLPGHPDVVVPRHQDQIPAG